MTTPSEIKEFLLGKFQSNNDLKDYFVANTTFEPMYYSGSNKHRSEQVPPFVLGLTSDMRTSQDALECMLTFIVGISSDIEPKEVNNITKYPAENILEDIAGKMIAITKEALSIGISGDRDFKLDSFAYSPHLPDNSDTYILSMGMIILRDKKLGVC